MVWIGISSGFMASAGAVASCRLVGLPLVFSFDV